MAKKSGGVNKSAAIRDYYTANPSAKPKAVSEALEKQGIKVTPAFVSTIRANSKSSRSRRSSPKPATAPRARASAAGSTPRTDRVSVETLLKVKKMINEIGSLDEVDAALNTLKKLRD